MRSVFMIFSSYHFYPRCKMSCTSERIARTAARAIVAIKRNFCALLFVRYASPPPPNTGDKPVPGACKRITVTSKIEKIICIIVITIWPIIYHFAIIMQCGICLPHLHDCFVRYYTYFILRTEEYIHFTTRDASFWES